jgi:hypothetical protein
VEFVAEPLPSAALAKVNAGQPIILLRNGQILDGRLVDIGGTSPLRLTVETPSGRRDFNSNEVAQAALAPLNGRAAATTGAGTPAQSGAPAQGGTVNVPANQQWTNTGIPVLRGQRISFNTRGSIMISRTVNSGPDGNAGVSSPGARYPLRGVPAGALIGRVGNGEPVPIGSNSQPIAMPANGPLMLGINDDVLEDNSGNYSVTISGEGDNNNNRNNRDSIPDRIRRR